MRIHLLNQFFWPDSAATSQLLTDLARGLVERGHEVFVICAESGYAPEDTDDPPPVTIRRVKAVRFARGNLGRFLSYASYFVNCAIHGLLLPRPDVVITLTTPPLLAMVGTLIKWVRGGRHFVWEMDVYPDVAVDLGMFKAGGLAERLTGRLADFSRHRADGIIALGDCMRDRLRRRGIPGEKILVAENWADGDMIRPVEHQLRDQITILYSGNLGLAHDVETIAQAIEKVQAEPEFRFIFAGSGPRRQALERWCAERRISNVEFRPYSQRSKLGDSLSFGRIGLVTQRSECLGSVVPSKVYGIMAAARPILFIGPVEATPARLIRQFRCGWHLRNGDVAGLVQLLRSLSADPSQLEEAGQRAREVFLQRYERRIGVKRICHIVEPASA